MTPKEIFQYFILWCFYYVLNSDFDYIPKSFPTNLRDANDKMFQPAAFSALIGKSSKVVFLFLLTDASLLPYTHLSIIFAMFIRISYLQWHTQHDVHCLSCWPLQIMISYDLYIFDVFCWSLWTLQICVPHTFSRGKFTNPCSLPRFVFEYFCRSFESLWERRYYSGVIALFLAEKVGEVGEVWFLSTL